MSNNFCPAGYESQSDDDMWDDDGPPDIPAASSQQRKKPLSISQNTSANAWVPKRQVAQISQFTGELTDDFRLAVMKGNMELFHSFLSQKGIDLDMPLRSGWTALMYACNYGNVEAVKLLLEKGADPNAPVDMFTPLMAACSCSSVRIENSDIVELLVNKGSVINDSDRYHMTSLMYAAREGKLKIVQFLVKHNLQMNAQDNRGFSALTWAASRGHMKICKVLVDAGANPDLQTTDGSTPAEIAEIHSQTLTSNFLSNCTSDNDKTTMQLESLPDTEQVEVQPQKTIQYGDLELFMSGLDLAQFIPTFHEHHVNFESLLKVTDDDLKQIGISQLGVRKKILNATYDVHKKTWQASSLPSLAYSKALSATDALAMVSNVNQHVVYMSSSIGYVDDQIICKPVILEGAPEGATLMDVVKSVDVTLDNIHHLHKELGHLRHTLSKLECDETYLLSDDCSNRAQSPGKFSPSRWLFSFGVIGLSVCGAGYLYKRFASSA